MAYNLPMQINLQAPTSDNIGKIKKSIENGLKHITIGNPTRNNLAEIRRFIKESFDKSRKVKLQIDPPSKANLKLIRATIEQSLSGIKIQGLGLDPKSIKATGIAQAKIIEAQGKAAAKLAEAKKPKSRTENEAIRRESTARARATTSRQKARDEVTKKIGAAKAKVTPEIEIAKAETENQNKKKMTSARILAAKKREEANEVRKNEAFANSEARKDRDRTDSQARKDLQRIDDEKRKNNNQLDIERIRQKKADDAKLRLDQKLAADLQSKQARDTAKIANDAKMTQAKENALKTREQSRQINDAKIAQAKADAIALRAQTQANRGSGGRDGGGGDGKNRGGIIGAIEGKVKSFAAYAVVSTAFLKLSGAISNATQDAINFEKELINIAQTTGDSVSLTKSYSDELSRISKEYNISLTKAAQLTRILTQTGLSFKEAAKGAEILARTSLLSGFDSLTDTTEGFIAVMATFDLSVTRAGQVLEGINKLSKDYAVESGDLVEAIKRAGGAFAAAGGSVEELLALITSVRSTTRESAETISTGFRTIFARLERPKTIEFFKKLEIELEDAEGNFIGPYASILKINEGLQRLNITIGSTRFAEIVEEIGGIRQISKVIPLLTQARKQQEALDKAFGDGKDTIQDIEKAQQGLGFKLGALQKEFAALTSEVVNSGGFKILADIFINLSSSVLKFTSSLKPLLPILTTIVGFVASRRLGQFLQGGGIQKTIKTIGFASGGFVPGSGSGDTVPAMLTPGEFVINKKSAQAFGYGSLEQVNKYAKGGIVGGIQRFAEGGSVKRTWSEFFGFGSKRRNSSTQEDSQGFSGLENNGRNLINTLDDLNRVVDLVTSDMGDLGKQIREQITLSVKATVREGKLYAGGFIPNTGEVSVSPQLGMERTAVHEIGHAADYLMGGGRVGTRKFPLPGRVSSSQFASAQEGTIQNKLAKIMQNRLYLELKAKGASEEQMQYRLKITEVYADFFAASDPAIRAILSSTTDAKEGMAQIAQLFATHTEKYKRIFPDIYNELKPIIDQSIAVQNSLAKMNEGIPESSTPPSTPTKRSLRKEAISGGRANIEKEIAQTSGVLKKLNAAQNAAEERWMNVTSRLEQVDKTLASGVKGNKAQKRAIEAKIKLEQEAIDAEKKFVDVTNKVANARQIVEAKRSALIKKAQDMKYLETADLKTGNKRSFGVGSAPAPKPPPVPFGPANATTIQKAELALVKLTRTLEKINITYIEAAGYVQTFSSMMSQGFGVNLNQEALTKGIAKGGVLSTASEFVPMLQGPVRKGTLILGESLSKAGGKVGQFGTTLLKNARFTTVALKSLSKGLHALSFVELAGGGLDAFFSTNYAKQRDNMIQLGDAAGAAAAAAKAYSQEQYRSIPIIGSFLTALQAGSGQLEENLGATGKLVVSTAELSATGVRSTRTAAVAQSEFRKQESLGDVAGQQKAFSEQIKAAGEIQSAIDKTNQRISETQAKTDFSAAGTAAAQVGGWGATIGGALGLAAGGVAGFFGGGGVGAVPAAAAGASIGAAAGGAVSAAVGGALNVWTQSFKNTKEVADAYAQIATQIKTQQDIIVDGIKTFGDGLREEAVRVIRGGGTIEDAISNITAKFGEENISKLLNGRKLGNDLKKEIEILGEEIEGKDGKGGLQKAIDEKQKEQKLLKDSEIVQREKLGAEIALLESQKAQKTQLRDSIIATQAAAENERKLAQERKVQAEAIAREIKLRKSFQKGVDDVNQSLRNIKEVREQIQNIGTGKLTSRQAAAKSGISDPTILEKSTDEIFRSELSTLAVADLIDKFAAAQGMGDEPGNEVRNVVSNFEKLNKITDPDILKRTMTGLRKDDETAPIDLKNKLLKEIDVKEGTNAVLEAAVLDYAKAVLEGGAEAAADAEQAAREKVSKTSTEFVNQYRELSKSLEQEQQAYRETEIAYIERKMQYAQEVYDEEKKYFEERLALTNKVRDALTVEPTGRGRAGFVANRAAADRAAQMAGLNARRAQGFANAGLGGANRSRAVQEVSGDMERLGERAKAGLDVGTAFETLAGTTNMLISTIRDEIEIENQYLDGLIESAKAQQEYTQSLYDAQGAIVRDLVTGTDEDIRNQLTSLNAAAMAAQQGSFAGIPENMKKDIFGIFDQFADVEIPGLGKTGRQAQKEITKNEMMRRFGVDAATAEQLASKAVQDRVPVDQRMAEQIENQKRIVEGLLAEEKLMKNAQLEKERITTELFALEVNKFAESVKVLQEKLGLLKPGDQGNQPQAALAPQAQPAVVENAKQENQPLQIVANGQQQFTVSLPDVQALVNQNITAMIFQTISQTFNNMAEGVRTAQNFEDMANLIANASTQTTTQNMGGMV